MSDTATTRRAYVLDDEAQVGTIVSKLLAGNGYAPQQFSEAMPFLVETKANPPELIVLDLALGQTDAVEVMRHLAAQKYRGKVLLISGRDETVLAEMEKIGQRHGLMMLPPL